MDVISDEQLVYQKLLHLKTHKLKLWLWQYRDLKNKSGKIVHHGICTKIDFVKRSIEFRPQASVPFKFEKSFELYVSSQDTGISFSTRLKSAVSTMIIGVFPDKIKILPGDVFSNMEIIESENEELYSAMRSVPRKQAKNRESVILQRVNSIDRQEESHLLYDMSQGGMSVLVDDPGTFLLGEQIVVLSVNRKQLTTEILGEVVNIKKVAGTFKEYKVGIKFLG